ncbi:fructose-bisphosphate aldolase class I, partial [Candidatus Uhrbacteria bacterium CG_4_10_14_0_2_um_filter_41_7]
HEIVKQMLAPKKGLLAADESIKSASLRLTAVGAPSTEEYRRRYRELFINTDGIQNYVSGIILHDETMYQMDNSGRPFLEVLKEKNILIGIKVDEGTQVDPDSENETVTEGLDDLEERLQKYVAKGAVFAKWRAVIKIGENLPSLGNIKKEAKNLASYAELCQKYGLVPVIEPEVLREGNHTITESEAVLIQTLKTVFEAIAKKNVDLSGLILKTSMVIAGSEQEKSAPEVVAKATVRALKISVPQNIGGIVFLSGGQESVEATENLNAINSIKELPRRATYSYARALQEDALKIWAGKEENVSEARKIFLHRLKMNSLASVAEYSPELE